MIDVRHSIVESPMHQTDALKFELCRHQWALLLRRRSAVIVLSFLRCHSARKQAISSLRASPILVLCPYRPRVLLAKMALHALDLGNVPSWDLAAPSSRT